MNICRKSHGAAWHFTASLGTASTKGEVKFSNRPFSPGWESPIWKLSTRSRRIRRTNGADSKVAGSPRHRGLNRGERGTNSGLGHLLRRLFPWQRPFLDWLYCYFDRENKFFKNLFGGSSRISTFAAFQNAMFFTWRKWRKINYVHSHEVQKNFSYNSIPERKGI